MYYISKTGLLWNHSLQIVSNGYINKGYIRNKVCVNMPNERMGQIFVFNHILVRNRFLNPVDDVDLVVHHINGVKWDNRVTNLQTIPHELNVAYARGTTIVARCVRGDGGVVRYVSVVSCCRVFNFNRS
jgi:hypothetical protein